MVKPHGDQNGNTFQQFISVCWFPIIVCRSSTGWAIQLYFMYSIIIITMSSIISSVNNVNKQSSGVEFEVMSAHTPVF